MHTNAVESTFNALECIERTERTIMHQDAPKCIKVLRSARECTEGNDFHLTAQVQVECIRMRPECTIKQKQLECTRMHEEKGRRCDMHYCALLSTQAHFECIRSALMRITHPEAQTGKQQVHVQCTETHLSAYLVRSECTQARCAKCI